MIAWLSTLDPTVIVALLVALVTYLDHRFLSPTAQAKLQGVLDAALSAAGTVMAALVKASPPGTTQAELETQLWTIAKTQLAHIGLNVDKLPPAVTAAVQALIAKYLPPDLDPTSPAATTAPLAPAMKARLLATK